MDTSTDYSQFLPSAVKAAKLAESIINTYYQQQFTVETKKDSSPVTQADIECETIIRETLQSAFPDHGFFGEELGQENIDAEFVWYIDPIDGTKSFVRGYPMFSTQIALRHGDDFVLGVSNAPSFDELTTAVKGQGAELNNTKINVSNIDRLQGATLSFGNVQTLLGNLPNGLKNVVQNCHRVRGYGDFFHYHLLASGKIDMIVETELNILDIAALSVIVTEAGGKITDRYGKPLGDKTDSIVATNGIFHEQLLLAMED
jgi:histidinol-phosphatase